MVFLYQPSSRRRLRWRHPLRPAIKVLEHQLQLQTDMETKACLPRHPRYLNSDPGHHLSSSSLAMGRNDLLVVELPDPSSLYLIVRPRLPLHSHPAPQTRTKCHAAKTHFEAADHGRSKFVHRHNCRPLFHLHLQRSNLVSGYPVDVCRAVGSLDYTAMPRRDRNITCFWSRHDLAGLLHSLLLHLDDPAIYRRGINDDLGHEH